jgi:prolyl-tRNA synthetase
VIVEVGNRDMDNGAVSLLRRDSLWAPDGKPAFQTPSREIAAQTIPGILGDIQHGLLVEAEERREANVTRGIDSFVALERFYASDARFPGWVEVQWSRPGGAELDAVAERLKALKLTIRNVPVDAAPADGRCIFTGAPAVERIIVARAY